MSGIELIAEERKRQTEAEGWTPEHDDSHAKGELKIAAFCYLFESIERDPVFGPSIDPPDGWPWERYWWKPTEDPIRQLVKAGALIAAEIDRLKRRSLNEP